MNEFVVRPIDIFDIVKRQRWVILITFVLSYIGVMGLFMMIPRSYQSEASLVIGVGYFQNPLIGDLISQTHDPSELRTEREKIIKASLGVEFAMKMGEKYALFTTQRTDSNRATEIEWFLKDLNVFPVTAAEFQIKYRSHTPEVADGVIRSALDAIREHMYTTRVQMLEEFSGVLSDEILNTADSRASNTKGAKGESQSDAMKAQVTAQIEVLEKRLNELHRSYNDQHPSIQAVKTEIEELREFEKSGGLSTNLTRHKVFHSGVSGTSALGATSIKDDLSKQKHLVNISLEMERKDPSMAAYLSLTKEPVLPKKPIFPKLRIFLLFGLVTGVMFSTLAAALLEFWARTTIPPEAFSKRLKMDFLGTLYIFAKKSVTNSGAQ